MKTVLYRFLAASLILVYGLSYADAQSANGKPLNFIIIFADDLGYSDIGCFGSPNILTPNLDKMALEGQRWTNFYAAENVCSPSRASLLTGRLPIRNGVYSDIRRVFFPDSETGLPGSEITIAEMFKSKSYSTACIGKWHLGHRNGFLPNDQGFDYYFGIPYSNDMDPTTDLGHAKTCADPKIEYFNVPLMRNREIIERPAEQHTITRRYTDEAINFIDQHSDSPFFIYLAHSMPHVPLFASPEFQGKSKRGLFGDVVQEIDYNVGRIFQTLKDKGLDQNTVVVFTSDNGPWVVMNENGGSAGMLKGAKATSYEGGVREPTIIWAPGLVKPGIVTQMGSTMDLFPTFMKLAGIEMPKDRTYDGIDVSTVLKGDSMEARKEFVYYHGSHVFAARMGAYKLVYFKNNPQGYPEKLEKLDTPQLYNVEVDLSERFDIAAENPQIVRSIEEMVTKFTAAVKPPDSELDKFPNAAKIKARRAEEAKKTFK